MNNFEPSTEGGYRRIEGFTKYNTNTITGQGNVLGVVLYKDTAIVARDQSGGNPKLFSGAADQVRGQTSQPPTLSVQT